MGCLIANTHMQQHACKVTLYQLLSSHKSELNTKTTTLYVTNVNKFTETSLFLFFNIDELLSQFLPAFLPSQELVDLQISVPCLVGKLVHC